MISSQYQVQPGEHVLEHHVGMSLRSVEYHIGKDRHDRLELLRAPPKGIVQLAHLRPELHAGRDELALRALVEVSVQTRVLFVI